MWHLEVDLVKEFYGYFAERWQVDLGDEFLEVFVSTVKIENREGGEGNSTRSTWHNIRVWWLWWARSGGVKADRERFEVSQGGQAIDEVDW